MMIRRSRPASLDDMHVLIHTLRRNLNEGRLRDHAAVLDEIEQLITRAGRLTKVSTVPAYTLAVARSMLILGHPSNALDRVLDALLAYEQEIKGSAGAR